MLRRLEEKDAPFMLEWMHDEEITAGFQRPFMQTTMEEVVSFIENSFDEENQSFAFVNEQDEYLGTISLKHICHSNERQNMQLLQESVHRELAWLSRQQRNY